ncbi:hypothetical protein [Lentilactobacillus senioris]|uniref:hypothetical protein n=1 Tax=Lentilactobacillus senioris TaxID=931534 RepID=UPI000AFD1C44|nr:hypothetical protein [Lentilactobacillus senioris]
MHKFIKELGYGVGGLGIITALIIVLFTSLVHWGNLATLGIFAGRIRPTGILATTHWFSGWLGGRTSPKIRWPPLSLPYARNPKKD